MMRFVGLAVLGACYAPTIHTGSPCVSSPCPAGLECSPVTHTCEVPSDAAIDTAAASCYGAGLVRVCFAAPPMQPVLLGSQSIDTATSPLCDPAQADACVIAGTQVMVQADFHAGGARPLVVVATDTITVDGTIDVASHRGGQRGAGADPASCATGTPPQTQGGGAGGSFGGAGGNGGRGTSAGGSAALPQAPAALRGGCPGQDGSKAIAGSAGHGGGAVYLIAATSIAIAGKINASGEGGAGNPPASFAGGSGGGAGGMIGLDAPSVSVALTAAVFANGGGGGEGAANNGGNDGTDPVSAQTAALGGGGLAGAGGDGGAGAAGATLAGMPGQPGTETGGGGGGGAGVIRVFPTQPLGGIISPPES